MLNKPFTLPCGATLQNRLVKAAMTERLSNADAKPNAGHFELYRQWTEVQAGLLITGNVMTSPGHMESAGNVIVDREEMLPELKQWTTICKKYGHHIWAQISHSGRQTSRFVNRHPSAPSAVQLKRLGVFGMPKVMTEADIETVIQDFIHTATLCKRGGFTGVQIHAAHGYLISQFLSPRTNKRSDQWGGSLENRVRLLSRIYKGMRAELGPAFPISVKLNSADFQRGGFTETDSLEVVQLLDQWGVDLLEISGGTYENVAFFLTNTEVEQTERTRRREAYFMDFAAKVRAVSKIPLMITGGFRTYDFCNESLQSGSLDFIGMARPFITNLNDLPAFMQGAFPALLNQPIRTGIQLLEDTAEGGYYARQLIRMARGERVKLEYNALSSSIFFIIYEMRKAFVANHYGRSRR